MSKLIEVLTLSLPLTAVMTTVVWFQFFIFNRDKDREDLKKLIKTFVIFALISGITGYILGTIGNANAPFDYKNRAFNEFCTEVGLTMSLVNAIVIIERILSKLLKKYLLKSAKEEYNLK